MRARGAWGSGAYREGWLCGTGLSGRDKEVDGPGRQAHGGDQSWSQEHSEELERVKKQSDPVRAGLRLRRIWHLPQGGEEVGVQAKKLWR